MTAPPQLWHDHRRSWYKSYPSRSLGTAVTTYGLIDSGSDVTIIDPSLVGCARPHHSSQALAVRTKRDLWPHLRQVAIPEVERNKVSVLIGTNVQEAFIPLEVKKGEPNEPFAIRSCLGWSILGGSIKCNKKDQFNLNHVSCEEISLSHQVEDFWRVESYPTEKLSSKSMSVEDCKAMKIIETTMSKMDNSSLPFNRAVVKFCESVSAAVSEMKLLCSN